MKNSRLDCGWVENLHCLNHDEMSKFRHICHIRGSLIYAQKLKLLILLEGEAKLISSKCGKDFIFSFVKPGNYVLLDDDSRLEITENSEVLEVNLNKIEELIENREFAMSLINALLKNILAQRKLVFDLVFSDVKERLREFLRTNSHSEKNRLITEFSLSMTTLATLLGAPRQNLSRALSELTKNGEIIKLSKGKFELNFK